MNANTERALLDFYQLMIDGMDAMCPPEHKRYHYDDAQHPGWMIVGCEDCKLSWHTTQEQLARWFQQNT